MLGHHKKSPEHLQRALGKILQVSESLFEAYVNTCQFIVAGGWQLNSKSVSNCTHFGTLLETGGSEMPNSALFVTMFPS